MPSLEFSDPIEFAKQELSLDAPTLAARALNRVYETKSAEMEAAAEHQEHVAGNRPKHPGPWPADNSEEAIASWEAALFYFQHYDEAAEELADDIDMDSIQETLTGLRDTVHEIALGESTLIERVARAERDRLLDIITGHRGPTPLPTGE